MLIMRDAIVSFVLATAHMISLDNWTFIQNTTDDDDNGGRPDKHKKKKKEIRPCVGIYAISW